MYCKFLAKAEAKKGTQPPTRLVNRKPSIWEGWRTKPRQGERRVRLDMCGCWESKRGLLIYTQYLPRAKAVGYSSSSERVSATAIGGEEECGSPSKLLVVVMWQRSYALQGLLDNRLNFPYRFLNETRFTWGSLNFYMILIWSILFGACLFLHKSWVFNRLFSLKKISIYVHTNSKQWNSLVKYHSVSTIHHAFRIHCYTCTAPFGRRIIFRVPHISCITYTLFFSKRGTAQVFSFRHYFNSYWITRTIYRYVLAFFHWPSFPRLRWHIVRLGPLPCVCMCIPVCTVFLLCSLWNN